jgi:hypothetical protein
MSEQLIILMILYGPGILGLIILLLVCIFARHWPAFIFGVCASIVLQLISFAFMFGLVGIGSWGDSSALDYPFRALRWALGVTGVLVGGKAMHIVFTGQRELEKSEKNVVAD